MVDEPQAVTPGSGSIEARLPGWYVRLIGLAVAGAALALLGIALALEPDPRGHGTHEALPMTGPCGFLVSTGYPCPNCGMTTAFSHTVRFQWLRAFWVQPAGFVFALATVVVGVGGLWTAASGRVPLRYLGWLTPLRLFGGLLVLTLAAWAFVLVRGVLTGEFPAR